MGVYIKGEITKEHLMGILEIYELEFTGGNDNRLVDVPYPHGRLIDVDALMKESEMAVMCEDCETDSFKCQNGLIEIWKCDVCDWVDNANVVIEREGE